MRSIKTYSEFKSSRVNEEFLGGLFKSLKNKLSLKFSKMFGSAKKADEVIDDYKKEIFLAHDKKREALKQYGTYLKSSKETGETDDNKSKQLVKNIEVATKNYNNEIDLIKKKFSIKIEEVIKGESNQKIKNYIELKKIEMMQELLSRETNSLLSDSGIDDDKIDDPYFNKMISELKKKISNTEELSKKQRDALDANSESESGFNIEEAKKSVDNQKNGGVYNYEWKESPFKEHKFQSGEKVLFFSITNYTSADDKPGYKGTEGVVISDEGDKVKVKTNNGKPDIPKKNVIKSDLYKSPEEKKPDVDENPV